MSISGKFSTTAFAIYAIFLLPFLTYAAGIDDITNYKSPPPQEVVVQPYTVQDIINNLPGALNNDGVYEGRWIDGDDPRAVATDEGKFGKCKFFYIRFDGEMGGNTLSFALRYLFPENEEKKAYASKQIKRNLAEIEREDNSEYRVKECADWRNYSANLKEILNAVIHAAPDILKEKQRLVEIARTAEIQKQNQANEKARAKQEAEAKAEADRQALALAERKGAEERANKLKICQGTNDYKLFEISATIEYNQTMAKNAALEIQRQKEAAKISGYVDKQVMYEMGNRVAGANRLNKENFEVYKKLGGAAKRIEAVKVQPNPCPQ